MSFEDGLVRLGNFALWAKRNKRALRKVTPLDQLAIESGLKAARKSSRLPDDPPFGVQLSAERLARIRELCTKAGFTPRRGEIVAKIIAEVDIRALEMLEKDLQSLAVERENAR